jgi:hypothetical protein
MKKTVKHYSRAFMVAILCVALFSLTGCTAVQISTDLSFHEDGTGTRTITAKVAKNDYQDGYGSAYYYLTQHGDQLAGYIQSAYKAAVAGSEDWLTVSVDDSGSDWEVIDLTFKFSSFEDYKQKLAALAYDETAAASYAEPELTANADGTVTYTESTAVLTAIFKSIQTTVIADTSIFDVNSTKDGVALNDGSADLQSLKDYGVELMKPEFGDSMNLNFGGEAAAVTATDGVYTITGTYTAVAVKDTSEASTESTPEAEAPKTGESPILAAAFVVGMAGFGVSLMVFGKHKVQNQ